MADELAFVQFPHPGGEHGPDTDDPSLKRWEHGKHEHRRKFMRAPGRWRSEMESTSQAGEIVFWGEWEADSSVSAIADRCTGGPAWEHRPFFEGSQNAPAGAVAQNTDPFVFGERFLYTFCRQPGNSRLRQLAPGSLILFGSKKSGSFVLDTVFVVADYVDHTRDTYGELAVSRTSEVFRAATLEPMYAWQGTHGGRLYFAATADQPVRGMFSFAPCLPAEARGTFARPAIELPGLVKPTLAMQARTTRVGALEDVHQIWRHVVDQVLDAGLALGTRVELPCPRTDGVPA
jgi:hypothetical protein